MLQNAASDLGLHCLPITLLVISRPKWINLNTPYHTCPKIWTRGPRWPCIAHLITRQILSQLAFRFKMMAILDFQSEWFFDLQVTLIWSYQSVGLLVQDNKSSKWLQGRPPWISNQNDFSYFWSTSYPESSYQVSSQLALVFSRSSKQIFKLATVVAILDFLSE